MTELYDAKRGLKDNTFFNHLLLQSEVTKLTKEPNFDPSKLEVDLKINGVQLTIGDFNEVLEDWSDRIEKSIKNQLEFNHTQDAVIEKAKELMKDKLDQVYKLTEYIESNMWRLED